MSHGTEHHLEESHHAEHAAHDEFTKRVAMTMAIIAAALAFVILQSHRAHNQTLQKQIQANMKKTEAANRWAQYQAKSVRRSLFEADVKMLPVLTPAEKAEEGAKVVDYFTSEIQRYKVPAGQEDDPKEKPEMESLRKMAEKLDDDAKELNENSEEIHHRADRFDTGELGLEFGLVLCSVSVLTKRALFWMLGIAGGAVGFLVAVSAYVPFLMPH
jgi:hypothetical protein